MVLCGKLGLLSLLCAGSILVAQQRPVDARRPWPVPTAATLSQQRAAALAPQTPIEEAHFYTLPELIDLAEARNPSTREAWYVARAEALGVKIARSELSPVLTAAMLSSTIRDRILVGDVYARQTLGQYTPVLETSYLVFDFGARSARIDEARQRLLRANLAFNRVHLDVMFQTAQRYYRLLDAIGQRDAAQANLDNATVVRHAVDARLAVGLSTLPDALEARAAAVQADYLLQSTRGDVSVARGELLTTVGADPSAPLQVQGLNDLVLPDKLDIDIHDAMARGLAERPELGEEVANRDASRAEIRGARSSFFPVVNFNGQVGMARIYGQQALLNPVYTGPGETWNAALSVRWDLFEGGRRRALLASTQQHQQEAEARIAEARDLIQQQIWDAYTRLQTALAERKAAAQLVQAAQLSYDAALKSYQQGLRSTVDVVTAQRTLAQALSNDVRARTDVLTQLAAFAYRTGDLLQGYPDKRLP